MASLGRILLSFLSKWQVIVGIILLLLMCTITLFFGPPDGMSFNFYLFTMDWDLREDENRIVDNPTPTDTILATYTSLPILPTNPPMPEATWTVTSTPAPAPTWTPTSVPLPPVPTSTPISVVAPNPAPVIPATYPCRAVIISPRYATKSINVVREDLLGTSSRTKSVDVGLEVVVLEKQGDWHHITKTNGAEIGWISAEYLDLSQCP